MNSFTQEKLHPFKRKKHSVLCFQREKRYNPEAVFSGVDFCSSKHTHVWPYKKKKARRFPVLKSKLELNEICVCGKCSAQIKGNGFQASNGNYRAKTVVLLRREVFMPAGIEKTSLIKIIYLIQIAISQKGGDTCMQQPVQKYRKQI